MEGRSACCLHETMWTQNWIAWACKAHHPSTDESINEKRASPTNNVAADSTGAKFAWLMSDWKHGKDQQKGRQFHVCFQNDIVRNSFNILQSISHSLLLSVDVNNSLDWDTQLNIAQSQTPFWCAKDQLCTAHCLLLSVFWKCRLMCNPLMEIASLMKDKIHMLKPQKIETKLTPQHGLCCLPNEVRNETADFFVMHSSSEQKTWGRTIGMADSQTPLQVCCHHTKQRVLVCHWLCPCIFATQLWIGQCACMTANCMSW